MFFFFECETLLWSVCHPHAGAMLVCVVLQWPLLKEPVLGSPFSASTWLHDLPNSESQGQYQCSVLDRALTSQSVLGAIALKLLYSEHLCQVWLWSSVHSIIDNLFLILSSIVLLNKCMVIVTSIHSSSFEKLELHTQQTVTSPPNELLFCLLCSCCFPCMQISSEVGVLHTFRAYLCVRILLLRLSTVIYVHTPHLLICSSFLGGAVVWDRVSV